jgi:tRNA pseudouridine65 synthase
MAHLRHPIVGDTTHGDGKHNKLFREVYDSHRLLLHASSLEFVHPFTNQTVLIKAKVDDTWQKICDEFAWQMPE